jgi:hypothetical protein
VLGCCNSIILTGRVDVGMELEFEFGLESPELARLGALGDAYVISMRTSGASYKSVG